MTRRPGTRDRGAGGLGGGAAAPELASVGGGVVWRRGWRCRTSGWRAQAAGEAMIDVIFDEADKSRTGDAGCPL